MSQTDQPTTQDSAQDVPNEEASQPFVGRWNQLVSTTNWEKGAIITQWREELADAGASPAEQSDEAWSRLVGGVTGQHVGRLRRVYERFGQVYTDYSGLYWSHFHAALDWDDAEMWLEGAIQSEWSVSQMRRTRWETLGQDETPAPSDADVVTGELDEDFEPALKEQPLPPTIEGTIAEVETATPASRATKPDSTSAADDASSEDDDEGASIYATEGDEATAAFVRPFENLGELPDDLADAFEAYKLAILRHKADDWKQISKDDILASLEALKELALAPAMDDQPS